MVDELSWARSADAAWWIKVLRADLHLNALKQAQAAYLDQAKVRIVPEPIGANKTQYVLRASEPVPAEIGAIIGDILHNLRSALDCAAFGLVSHHVKQPLTPGEERAVSYPIFTDSAKVASFLDQHKRLFGEGERMTIARLQPGYHSADLKELGLNDESESEDLTSDHLYLLDQLCNIDKHRRLHVTVLHPDIIYWTSNGRTASTWVWGSPPYTDGSVIGVIAAPPTELPPAELYHNFVLALAAPEHVAKTDVIGLLQSLRRMVASDLLPRLLASAGTTAADKPQSITRTWSLPQPFITPR